MALGAGTDSLAGDRLGTFNLSSKGHAACVEYVRVGLGGRAQLSGGALTWWARGQAGVAYSTRLSSYPGGGGLEEVFLFASFFLVVLFSA